MTSLFPLCLLLTSHILRTYPTYDMYDMSLFNLSDLFEKENLLLPESLTYDADLLPTVFDVQNVSFAILKRPYHLEWMQCFHDDTQIAFLDVERKYLSDVEGWVEKYSSSSSSSSGAVRWKYINDEWMFYHWFETRLPHH